MHPRRTAALAVTTAVVAAGLAATVPPSSATTDDTPGYSVRPITVTTRVGPDDDIECLVDADLYVPDGTSSRNRKPAILTTNGFGGSKDDSNQAAVGRGFVKQGYVVLSYTGLGFPDSGCEIRLDDPAYDGKAGKQLVDVLAGTRSFVEDGASKRLDLVSRERAGDPRVGMIGGSYGGQVQYAVAMQDRRVDALIPLITWNDLAYSLAPNNTGFRRGVTSTTPGVAKRQWIDLFFSVGILDGVQGSTVDPSRNVPPCPNFTDEACVAAVRLNTLGYPDAAALALTRRASVATYADKVKAPTLIVQGQKDTLFNLQESVATYRQLRAAGTEARLVWQSWGHSQGGTPAPGELDFDAASLRSSYLGSRFLDWMNRYVKGQTSAPVGPRFSYFRDWVRYDTRPAKAGRAIDAAYVDRAGVTTAPNTTLYLSGADALVRSRSAVRAGSASYANAAGAPTSYSETSGVEGAGVDNPPSDAPGTFAAWTTRPLRNAVNLVGSSRLTVRLDAPVAAQAQAGDQAARLVVFAKIYDVAPDGTKTLQHRLVSPVRVPDVTRPVSIELPGVVQQFKAGHRIQVVLAASDAAYAGNAVVQPVTVRTTPAAPGTLRMPLVGSLAFR